jgi:hypothetical protein
MRIVWSLFTGAIVLVLLLQCAGISSALRGMYFDRGWAHFLVFAIAVTLCMLAWKHRTAFAVASGLFILSGGLSLLHSLVFRSPIDYFGILVNLFGILAGVLLGLNILVFRSREKDHLAT